MNKKTLLAVPILLIIFISACNDNAENEKEAKVESKKGPSWLRNIIGNFRSKDTIYFDSTYVDSFLSKYSSFKEYKADIKKFYSDRKYSFAWFDNRGIIEQSDNLYHRVKETKNEGSGNGELTIPYEQRFDELMNRPNRKKNRDELELMLTSQYFKLANDVWKGLSDKDVKRLGWFIPKKKVSYAAFLDSLLKSPEDEFLEKEPVNAQYEALRKQLIRYKELDSVAGTVSIPAPKKALKTGDSSAIIPLIRTRLVQLGDLSNDNKQNIYDSELERGVVSFQQRHGLKDDGKIGKEMVDELNVPIRKRIQTLLVNMERTRWVPVEYTSSPLHILVNIPEYKLHLYEGDKETWSCNVVVGEEENKTVVFRGVLNNIVFSPHWNIPESIVKEEILPEIEKDPSYLEKQDLEITGEKDGIPVIRQKPGKENSLGLVKFMFPNTHNIYLHDSPAKELFNRNERAFSHGCVRVSEPVKLAATLLRDQPEWTDQRIDEAMHSGEEKWVKLKTKVPVVIAYFTAWVDSSGKINFRKDIYDNDPRLASMILE